MNLPRKKQENKETILALTIPQLNESSSPEGIKDAWITHFFEKCSNISDRGMLAEHPT
jgi:hypothetical protein